MKNRRIISSFSFLLLSQFQYLAYADYPQIHVPKGACVKVGKTVLEVCSSQLQAESGNTYWSFVETNYPLIQSMYSTPAGSCESLSSAVSAACNERCTTLDCLWVLQPITAQTAESDPMQWIEGTGSTNMPPQALVSEDSVATKTVATKPAVAPAQQTVNAQVSAKEVNKSVATLPTVRMN